VSRNQFFVGHRRRTQTALGAFYRRLTFRVGKAKAVTATARKLAILGSRALKGELAYGDPGADASDHQQGARTRQLPRGVTTATRLLPMSPD
jgi:hypothetical protein